MSTCSTWQNLIKQAQSPGIFLLGNVHRGRDRLPIFVLWNHRLPRPPTSVIMLFVYIILNFVLSVGGDNANHGELHFVVVIYRHGDRSPLSPYPKDPHYSESLWPNGWSQLTNLGKLQQFELGKWLRSRYCRFLPLNYSPKDIYVLSSDYDRTLISAYSNLAGLYDCWMKENKIRGLEWIGIPVHTMPREMDTLLAWKKPCPLYEKLFIELEQSEEVEIVNEYYGEFFRFLSENSGATVKTIMDVLPIYDVLHIENLHEFQLPSWTKKAYPEPIQEIAEFAYRLHGHSVQLKRLRCGPLLKHVLSRIDEKKDGVITHKMWMYSAHESTIASLMQCLNVYDGLLPPYTAMLIFELYKKNHDWWLKLSYKTPTTVQILRIPQCDRLCPLSSFKMLVRPVIPGDWEQECNNVTAEDPPDCYS